MQRRAVVPKSVTDLVCGFFGNGNVDRLIDKYGYGHINVGGHFAIRCDKAISNTYSERKRDIVSLPYKVEAAKPTTYYVEGVK